MVVESRKKWSSSGRKIKILVPNEFFLNSLQSALFHFFIRQIFKKKSPKSQGPEKKKKYKGKNKDDLQREKSNGPNSTKNEPISIILIGKWSEAKNNDFHAIIFF